MSTGVTVQAGWVDKGSSWNTSTSVVTGWLPVLSESLVEAYENIQSQVLGQVSAHTVEQGVQLVQGDLVLELDYVYGYQLLEYVLGTLVSTEFRTANTLPIFGLNIDKGLKRWEFASCMVNRMAISCEADQVATMTLNLVCADVSRTSPAFPTLTSTSQERAVFNDLSVELGDKADALSLGTDFLRVDSMELVIENNLQVDAKATGNSGRILEPVRNGFRTGSLNLNLARYDTDTIAAWKAAHTELQARVKFNGSAADITANCPTCFITEGADANVGGPEVLTDSVTLELTAGTSAYMANADMLTVDRA